MNKREARVARSGRNSLVVVLPKDWTRGMQVEAGDVVEIVYDEDVSIRAKRRENKKAAMTETAARSNVVKHVDDAT